VKNRYKTVRTGFIVERCRPLFLRVEYKTSKYEVTYALSFAVNIVRNKYLTITYVSGEFTKKTATQYTHEITEKYGRQYSTLLPFQFQ